MDKELGKRKNVQRRDQMQSIRIGDFTAVRYSVTSSSDPFRLYNVVNDPHEDHNLAGEPACALPLAKARGDDDGSAAAGHKTRRGRTIKTSCPPFQSILLQTASSITQSIKARGRGCRI